MADSDVKFIRVNGRVVPIKKKNYDKSKMPKFGSKLTKGERSAILRNTNISEDEIKAANETYRKIEFSSKYRRKATAKERLRAGAVGAAVGGALGMFAGKKAAAIGALALGGVMASKGTRFSDAGKKAAANESMRAVARMRMKKNKTGV